MTETCAINIDSLRSVWRYMWVYVCLSCQYLYSETSKLVYDMKTTLWLNSASIEHVFFLNFVKCSWYLYPTVVPITFHNNCFTFSLAVRNPNTSSPSSSVALQFLKNPDRLFEVL